MSVRKRRKRYLFELMLEPRVATSIAPPGASRPPAVLPFLQAAALLAALCLSILDEALPAGGIAIAATLVFLIGGLPHGAFDIHRTAIRARLGSARLLIFLGLYVAIVIAALAAWTLAPALLLPLFLITAVVHFAEDWPEIKEPLFRIALGFAPICAIGVGHPGTVEPIFAAMSDPVTAGIVTKSFVLFAPVTLLIAAVGLAITARELSWYRPLLFGALIGSLFIVPPIVGFALFFCFFHTPRHMLEIRGELSDWPMRRLAAVAAGISALAAVFGFVLLPMADFGSVAVTAAGFQLLAALALPHQSVGLLEKLVGGTKAA